VRERVHSAERVPIGVRDIAIPSFLRAVPGAHYRYPERSPILSLVHDSLDLASDFPIVLCVLANRLENPPEQAVFGEYEVLELSSG